MFSRCLRLRSSASFGRAVREEGGGHLRDRWTEFARTKLLGSIRLFVMKERYLEEQARGTLPEGIGSGWRVLWGWH